MTDDTTAAADRSEVGANPSASGSSASGLERRLVGASEASSGSGSEWGVRVESAPGWRPWIRSAATGAAIALALVVGLGLGRTRAAPPGSSTDDAHEHDRVWTCSMHPQIRMGESGRCPICGMDLVPADTAPAPADHAESVVTLSARARALAGVRTAAVVRTEPRAELRLLGRVDYDETRLRMVTPWTDGRIDRLKVRVTGARVRKGQVVAQLYSPEVYAAMRELVVAIKQAKTLSEGLHGSSELAAAMVSSAREKLRLLGISETELKSIETSGRAPKHVSVRSPFSGTVIERNVEEGDYVEAGTGLYHVANLSKVWVQIDAYESDLPHLALGQEVSVEIDAIRGETFSGQVAFIDPVVDRSTRTARVRVEVENPERRLRPGMFARAVVEADIGDQRSYLVIPSSAVLFTGRRSVVYVAVPGRPGAYALREVRLGPRAGPVYPVLEGLSQGERVVEQGAFVVDADLQLQGGRSMMTLSDDRAGDAPAPTPRTPRIITALQPVLEGYLEVQRSLAADRLDDARVALDRLAQRITEVDISTPPAAVQAWAPLASALTGHARQAAKAQHTGETRKAFEHLSGQILVLLRTFGNPLEDSLRVAYCPMAFDDRGAQWVQAEAALANPYYGAAMLRCGEVETTVTSGERLADPGSASPPPRTPAAGDHL